MVYSGFGPAFGQQPITSCSPYKSPEKVIHALFCFGLLKPKLLTRIKPTRIKVIERIRTEITLDFIRPP
jgi:hypothetical protein